MGEPTASPTFQSTERVPQKSDRSESLGQLPIDPASGLARLACRRFFFFIRDPSDAHTHLVSNRDSMQYACVRYGGRGVVLCCCRSQLNPREPQSGPWGASPVFAPCLSPERPSLPMTASASRSWCNLNRDTIFDTKQTRIQSEPGNLSNRNPSPVYVTLPFPGLRIVLLAPPPRSHIHIPPTPHILRNSTY